MGSAGQSKLFIVLLRNCPACTNRSQVRCCSGTSRKQQTEPLCHLNWVLSPCQWNWECIVILFTESDHYLIFPFFIHYLSPHVSPAFHPEAASLWTCRFSPFPFLLIAPKDPEEKKCQNDCPQNRLVLYLGCFLNLSAIAERQIEV